MNARKRREPFFVLGAGSNVLVRDQGFNGIVISTCQFNHVSVSGVTIFAECGVPLSTIEQLAVKYEITGLEFLSGIPGTVGGALVMNSGIKERSISETVCQVKVLDERLEEKVLDASQIKFFYRSSSLAQYPFIISAHLKGERGERSQIKKRIAELIKWRMQSQPRGLFSAGSIFRNPQGKVAGKLIAEAGCKGWRCGGAIVSAKHANFIVNEGQATASDILNLIARVRAAVYQKFGVYLELEVKIL